MKIEHIAMYINDLEKARSFFMQYLGARSNEGYHNPRTDFRSYFLSFDDGARLEIMNKPGMKDEEKAQARTGYIHIAFSLGSKERVDALTKKLREDGYEVISGPRTTGDGYYELHDRYRRKPNRTHCIVSSGRSQSYYRHLRHT